MKTKFISLLHSVIFLGGLFSASFASAATEFVSVVDPGLGSGYDYASLSAWEAATQTNLTLATTKVFSGTRTGTLTDNQTMYLCRGGTYQTVTANRRHATATQILAQTISNGSFVFQSGDIWYTNNTCNSASYFTISDAGDSVINVAKCRATGGTADTTKVTINGFTTSATNYIKVYTDQSENYRHSGKWDTNKYRVSVDEAYYGAFQVSDNHVRVEGLQIEQTGAHSNATAVLIDSIAVAASSDIIFNSNLIRGSGTGTSADGMNIGSGKITVRNSVIYSNAGNGIWSGYNTNEPSLYVENSTIVGNGNYGINVDYNCSGNIKNTYSGANTSGDYFQGGGAGSLTFTTSASSDSTVWSGVTNNIAHSTSSGAYFTNITGGSEDYHIQSASVLKDVGTSQSPTYTTDIDGQSRPIPYGGSWDIGADEYGAKQVYYSVGQDASTNNMTGTPTVTISGGTATFSTAQTGNIGVGDRITYNTSSVAYISGKVSTTQWNVVTATGQAPSDIAGSTVVSIKREYTSLSGAEAGATDSNHLNTTDLVAGNYQLNFPCYYDSGADTTAVTIDGYTTGSVNYIKVYTPNNTATEVNQSQRHGGMWNATKYNIQAATDVITINDDFVRVVGLQIYLNSSSQYYNGILTSNAWGASGDAQLENNVIKGNRGGTAWQAGINAYQMTGTTTVKIWNNIIYDIAIGIWSYDNRDTAYVYAYNNTITDIVADYGGQYGIWDQSGNRIVAINNIVTDGGNTQTYVGTFRSGTDYNSTDSTDAIGQGTHNLISQTFTFVDEANDDFHLAAGDTGAKNKGADLSEDANLPFSEDIDGEIRPIPAGASWDIGADEAPGAVIGSPNLPGGSKMTINMSLTDKLTDGLVGMWSFDGPDVSGNTAYDRSPVGTNHGTISGATLVRGKKGSAMSFDGVDDWVSLPSSSSIRPVDAITVAGWIKADSLSLWDSPIGNTNYQWTSGFGVFYDNGQLKFFINHYSDNVATISFSDTSNWHYFIGTWDGSMVRIYIDGVQGTADTYSGSIVYDDDTFISGIDSPAMYNWDGLIDEVRIYNRALSESETEDLYHMGQARVSR